MTKRLMVLDDEALIAWGVASELELLGWDVPHVVGTVAQALNVLASDEIDAAILDFNLRKETSEDVARKMIEQGLPFVFVSGTIAEHFPNFGQPIEVVTKPIDYAKVSAMLSAMVVGAAMSDSTPSLASRAP